MSSLCVVLTAKLAGSVLAFIFFFYLALPKGSSLLVRERWDQLDLNSDPGTGLKLRPRDWT